MVGKQLVVYLLEPFVCHKKAASLIEAMNPKADPCQDFFEFACGGWVAKHPIPSTKSRFTQFDILEDQLTNIIRRNVPIFSENH